MNQSVQDNEQATGQPTAEPNDFTAENQEDNKYFTQDDLDKIVKDRLDRERKKLSKQYEGIDVQKYRELTDAEEQQKVEQQKARGEFETILKQTVEKRDTVIQSLQKELHSIKVDGSLLNAASGKRAVNPSQVVSLLKANIRLGETGEVEVLDNEGNIRYTDNGTLMRTDDLVEEFLSQNPHFIQAGPNGSGSQSKIANTGGKDMGKVDVSSLNMNNPADREIYKKIMKSKGIRV
tara:strand:- start:4607 stop:5311 length:705 start_codon:yes stop_codon:yes gene_type:complete